MLRSTVSGSIVALIISTSALAQTRPPGHATTNPDQARLDAAYERLRQRQSPDSEVSRLREEVARLKEQIQRLSEENGALRTKLSARGIVPEEALGESRATSQPDHFDKIGSTAEAPPERLEVGDSTSVARPRSAPGTPVAARPSFKGDLVARLRQLLELQNQSSVLDSRQLTCKVMGRYVVEFDRLWHALETDLGVTGKKTPTLFLLVLGQPDSLLAGEDAVELRYRCKDGEIWFTADRFRWDQAKVVLQEPDQVNMHVVGSR